MSQRQLQQQEQEQELEQEHEEVVHPQQLMQQQLVHIISYDDCSSSCCSCHTDDGYDDDDDDDDHEYEDDMISYQSQTGEEEQQVMDDQNVVDESLVCVLPNALFTNPIASLSLKSSGNNTPAHSKNASSLSLSSSIDYVEYSESATLFASAACQSICVVSQVLKNEAECVKKRIQNFQQRIEQQKRKSSSNNNNNSCCDSIHYTVRSRKKQRFDITGTNVQSVSILPNTSTNHHNSFVHGQNDNNNDDDDSLTYNDEQMHNSSICKGNNNNTNDMSLIPISEQVSIREQTYRMKRLSILLREMDTIHVQLLREMKQCAFNAALSASSRSTRPAATTTTTAPSVAMK